MKKQKMKRKYTKRAESWAQKHARKLREHKRDAKAMALTLEIEDTPYKNLAKEQPIFSRKQLLLKVEALQSALTSANTRVDELVDKQHLSNIETRTLREDLERANAIINKIVGYKQHE